MRLDDLEGRRHDRQMKYQGGGESVGFIAIAAWMTAHDEVLDESQEPTV
jgi:hypothetical protein